MNDGSAHDSYRCHFGRIGRLVCGLAAAIGLMAAVPAVASALTITRVSLTPGTSGTATTSRSGPGGSVIPSPVTTDSHALSIEWSFQRGSGQTLANGTCQNFTGTSGTAALTRTVNVTLPRSGTHNVYFKAFANSGCPGTGSSSSVYPSSGTPITVTVNAPGFNPPLPARCGLNVVLVLDESASIPSFGATAAVQAAAREFVKKLSGTGSRLAIVAFSIRARLGIDYNIVNSGSENTFLSWIGEHGVAGTTNPANGSARLQPCKHIRAPDHGNELAGRLPRGQDAEHDSSCQPRRVRD